MVDRRDTHTMCESQQACMHVSEATHGSSLCVSLSICFEMPCEIFATLTRAEIVLSFLLLPTFPGSTLWYAGHAHNRSGGFFLGILARAAGAGRTGTLEDDVRQEAPERGRSFPECR